MSEISKERVEALASNILECHDVKPSEVKALAALALMALRERAEPDQHEAHIRREVNVGGNTWVQCSKQAFEREKARGALCRVIYESPPEPVVPDGLKRAVEFYEQVKRENTPTETGAWKDAVNWVLDEACRAAMLSAPGKN